MPQYPYQYAMNGVNTATVNPMSYPYPNTPTYTYGNPYQGQNFTVNQPVQNQQMVQQNQMTPPTIHADIIQADEEQAREYNIAAGCTQMFMSKDDDYIFVKTAYANGNYDFERYVKDKKPTTPQADSVQNDYITREEFEKRLAEIAYKPKYKSHQNYKKEENVDG